MAQVSQCMRYAARVSLRRTTSRFARGRVHRPAGRSVGITCVLQQKKTRNVLQGGVTFFGSVAPLGCVALAMAATQHVVIKRSRPNLCCTRGAFLSVVVHSGSPNLCDTCVAIVRPPPALKVRTHMLHSGALLANLLHSDGASSQVYALRCARVLVARHVALCAWPSAQTQRYVSFLQR